MPEREMRQLRTLLLETAPSACVTALLAALLELPTEAPRSDDDS